MPGLRKLTKREGEQRHRWAQEQAAFAQRQRLAQVKEQAFTAVERVVAELGARLKTREERRGWSAKALSGDEGARGPNVYRAASMRPNYAGWRPDADHPDVALEDELELMRTRGRDLMASNPIASAMTNSYTGYVCGHAPWSVQSVARDDRMRGVLSKARVREWRQRCEDRWQATCDKLDDAEREGGYWETLRTIFRGWLEGDVFVEPIRNRKPVPWRPCTYGFKVREGDLVRTPIQMRSQRDVRIGIRYRDAGPTPSSYFVFDTYPTDIYDRTTFREVRKRDKLGRLQMRHIATRVRPSQGRGLPWLTPCIPDIEDTGAYLENELMASLAAGSIGLLLKNMGGTPEPPGDGSAPKIELRAGGVAMVPEGFEPEAFNPQRPNNTFEPFISHMQRMACAAVGFSHMLAFRDFRGANYSVMRAVIMDSAKGLEWQQTLLARGTIIPDYRGVIEAEWMAGRLPDWAPLFDADGNENEWTDELMRVTATPPAFGWISPREEVAAYDQAVKSRFMSRREVIGLTSQRDPDVVFEEIAEENAYLDELGVASNDTAAGAPSTMPEDASTDPNRLPPDIDAQDAEDAADGGDPPTPSGTKRPPPTPPPPKAPSPQTKDGVGDGAAPDVVAAINAYGIAVRSGVVTPQEADEDHFRQRLSLPAKTPAVATAWSDDGGVRRPITLAQPKGAAPPPAPAAGDQPTDGSDQ